MVLVGVPIGIRLLRRVDLFALNELMCANGNIDVHSIQLHLDQARRSLQ